jgi:putative hydrolase of the HAD superfamily
VSETIRGLARRFPGLSTGALETAYYQAAAAVWEVVKDGAPPAWGCMEAEWIVREVWERALRCVHVTDEGIVAQAADTYLGVVEDQGAPAYPDAVGCLNALQGRFRLGLVTNGVARIQERRIASAGLTGFFASITIPEMGSGKPCRRVFKHALTILGVAASHSVYVGDSLQWDVRGANDAGMVSVWLNRTGATREHSHPEPDAEIASLQELPHLIASMSEAEC